MNREQSVVKSHEDTARDIFGVAVEMASESERRSYINEACNGVVTLRSEVEALLAAYRKAGDFLESGPYSSCNAPLGEVAEQLGTTIGPYKLLQKIGEGGFGVVFMAEQVEPVRRKIALKVIKPGMDTKEVVARFEAERQALAMMDHPHIAHVFDGGVTKNGRPYFVMELVHGIPISEYCDTHNCRIDERLRLFSDVCRAIQHAHQKGIIHRDLKPANILVTQHGGKPVPKVIDFGVAKALHQELTQKTLFTAYGQIIGTPQYMSPEQAVMSDRIIDTRSDVYALGILLYELLTGTTPLNAEQLRHMGFAAMMELIREANLPLPSRRLSTLGEQITTVAQQRSEQPLSLERRIRSELDWIVMKALEKEPDKRYATSLDLAEDVESYLSNEPVRACPPSHWYRISKFASRHKLPVMAALTVSLSLIIGLAGVSFGFLHVSRIADQLQAALVKSEHAKILKEQEASRAKKAEQRARDTAEERRRELYVNTIHLAEATWKNHDIRRVKALLDGCDQMQGDKELRRWPYYYLRNLEANFDGVRHVRLPRKPLRLDVSPDGKLIAVAFPGTAANERTGVPIAMLLDLETGEIIDSYGQLKRNTWQGAFVAFSNDAKSLVYPSDDFRSIVLRNIKTGKLRVLEGVDKENRIEGVAFSPDGINLAIAQNGGLIAVRNLETNALVATAKGWTRWDGSLAFSHNSEYLAIAGYDKAIRIWNVGTDIEEKVLQGHTAPAIVVAFSSDDKFLVSGGTDARLLIWDVASGKLHQTLMIAEDAIRSLAFSPHEDTMAAGIRDGTVRVWSYPDFETLDVVPGYGALYALDYLPDGSLAFGGNIGEYSEGLVFWKPRSLNERGVLKCNGWVEDLVFSSNCNLLASVTRNQSPEVRVWELDGAYPSEKPPITAAFDISHIASSTNGRLAVGDRITTSVQFFDFATGRLMTTIQGDDSTGISCMAFSPNGERLVIGCLDGKIFVWEVDGEHLVWTDSVYNGPVSCVCFCEDKNTILTGGRDGNLRLWNIGDGAQICDLGNYVMNVESVSCSSDGKQLAAGFFSGEGRGILLWDRLTNQSQRLLGHKYSVRSVAFLHGENTLISIGDDRMLKVWDLETQQERLTISAGPHIYTCMAISPDNEIVAAGSRDGTILIYRAPVSSDEGGR
jgi:eukaryotic-like serine/threonine-protein kinase